MPAALPAGRAVMLGLLQGPTELLPVSSSAHVAVVPWLVGRPGAPVEPDVQQAFEVALHAGTALALGIAWSDEIRALVATPDPGLLTALAASAAVPALVGLAGEEAVAARLGRPSAIAAGLVVGALALVAADRSPQQRSAEQAGLVDGLWLGVAQAAALVPGVSRNGATLAAARARGFRRPDANRLSRYAAAPVIVGATGLKGLRLARRGPGRRALIPVLAGAAGAALSTFACRGLVSRIEADRPLAPYGVYRLALAATIMARIRRDGRRSPAALRPAATTVPFPR